MKPDYAQEIMEKYSNDGSYQLRLAVDRAEAEIRNALLERDRLREALAETRKDSERLDWLEDNIDEIFTTRDLSFGTVHRLTYCAPESGCEVSTTAKTLREAIDLAMGDAARGTDPGTPTRRVDGSALETLQSQLDKALDERDRLLAFNQELDRERVKAIEERDAALARATCDGSFERQGEESELAAIAAVWNADPRGAYESPAQVIGWLEARVSAAKAALKRYGRHEDNCIRSGRPLSQFECECGLDAVRRD